MKYYKRYSQNDKVDYYNQFLITEYRIESFITRLKNLTDIHKIAKIRCKNLDFDINCKALKNILGKPNFVLKNCSISPQVYFYKDVLLNNKIVSQFHFFDEKYAFSYSSIIGYNDGWKTDIKIALSKKYVMNAYDLFSDTCSCLIDETGNKIFIVEDILIHIFYVSAHIDLSEILVKIINGKSTIVECRLKKIQDILIDHL